MIEKHKYTQGVSEEMKEKLKKEIPRILGLKAMGLTIPQIAEKLGVSPATLKRYAREEPDLQDVCCSLDYRREYVLAKHMEDYKAGRMSERGGLKLLEIIANLQLLDIRKDLLRMEKELREKGELSEESRLQISGISEEELNSTMEGMSRRGSRAKGDYFLQTPGQSYYNDPTYKGPGFNNLR